MRRWWIAGLSLVGLGEALYMLAFQSGLLGKLWCPFSGEGCERVGRSPHHKHLGVPNAAVGAVSYGALATLAVWAGPTRRPRQELLMGAITSAALLASAFLTWEQAAKIHAYCFFCLTSAGVNAALFALAAPDAVSAARSTIAARQWRGSNAARLLARRRPARRPSAARAAP